MRSRTKPLVYGLLILVLAIAAAVATRTFFSERPVPEEATATEALRPPARPDGVERRASEEDLERARRQLVEARSAMPDPSVGDRTGSTVVPEPPRVQPARPPFAGAQPPVIDPEVTKTLLSQIDRAEQQLDAARARVSGGAEAERLEVAAQLLATTRERLLADDPANPLGLQTMDEQIAAALDSAEEQMEYLRAALADHPNAAALEQQLDRWEQQLNLARSAQAASASGSRAVPEISEEGQARMLEDARNALEQARRRAADLPDAASLLAQIDSAERQLDQAEASAKAASPAKPPDGR